MLQLALFEALLSGRLGVGDGGKVARMAYLETILRYDFRSTIPHLAL